MRFWIDEIPAQKQFLSEGTDMQQQKPPPTDMTTNRSARPVGIFDKTAGKAPSTPGTQEPAAMPRQPNPTAPAVQELPPEQQPMKEDFPDMFKEQEKMMRKMVGSGEKKVDLDEAEVNKVNAALSNDKPTDDEDIVKISAEDMKLAEQLIFNGYAESSVVMKNFPDRKFIICSTNAEEIGLLDEIVFEKIRSVKQNEDGSVEMPENAIRSLRNALFISISYRGTDGKDFAPDPLCHLNTIKRAITKMGELYNIGEMTKAEELKTNIKKAMNKRVMYVKRMPTPLIDFITNEKYNFDVKMLKVMNEKNIIPLS
jgi:hypothetical protein